jgi:hypothetical protein
MRRVEEGREDSKRRRKRMKEQGEWEGEQGTTPSVKKIKKTLHYRIIGTKF